MFNLGCELDEVEAKLLRREVESVLVDGLDALCGQPEPNPSVAFLPKHFSLLQVNMLHLSAN